MSLNEEERNELIDYRLNQAEESVEEVSILLGADKLRAANSRIYYGIFYAVMALALKSEFKTSKHQQLIGWFNKEFIHTGLFDKTYGKILRKAYQYRIEGDYEPMSQFDKEEVEALFRDMKAFIQRVRKYLKQ